MKTMIKNYKLKSRGLSGHFVLTDTEHSQKIVTSDKQNTKETTSILISRSINKADKILNNVCKGLFPGDYSDH